MVASGRRRTGRPETQAAIPLFYRILFLYLEPASILVGAFLAIFYPQVYLTTVHALPTQLPATSLSSPTPTVSVLLAQLANVYVLFAVLENTILRCSDTRTVWNTFLRGALIADVGHLLIVTGRGVEVSWAMLMRLAEVGVADWGKPAIMICFRVAFLSGIGLGSGPSEKMA